MGHDLIDHTIGQSMQSGNLPARAGNTQAFNGNRYTELIKQTSVYIPGGTYRITVGT